jgi:hypothetical protein
MANPEQSAFQPISPAATEQPRSQPDILARQEALLLLFYDEALQHRLSKRVPYPDRSDLPRILARADECHAAIAPWHLDFERAKAAVLKATTL